MMDTIKAKPGRAFRPGEDIKEEEHDMIDTSGLSKTQSRRSIGINKINTFNAKYQYE